MLFWWGNDRSESRQQVDRIWSRCIQMNTKNKEKRIDWPMNSRHLRSASHAGCQPRYIHISRSQYKTDDKTSRGTTQSKQTHKANTWPNNTSRMMPYFLLSSRASMNTIQSTQYYSKTSISTALYSATLFQNPSKWVPVSSCALWSVDVHDIVCGWKCHRQVVLYAISTVLPHRFPVLPNFHAQAPSSV